MTVTENLESIFPGDSEMARLMRAYDWSTSEVGVPEKWPESLKAAVRICVGSRNPIVIWWGKKALTQIYNDGYMRILTAAKHPQWLGRSGAECWIEIMDTMGPLWDQVLETGEATWFEDFLYVTNRNLPREECYFTFSYSALRNDSAIVEGILCICYETTSRVIGDGRLRTLRDLGRTIATAQTPEAACKTAAEILGANLSDVPFSLLYLLDDEVRQARLVATSGFAHEDEAGPDGIDLTSVDDSGWPLKRVLESGSAEVVFNLSSRMGQLPGGSWPESPETAVIVPITSAGQIRGFLVAGFSTRRIVDADYRSFFDLVAGHLSTAISNARTYEAERKRAEALAEIDRAKTAFFSNVSHEFRTPLTLMLGPLEEELRENPNSSERLRIAHRNSLRLLKLVNTLLDFARTEAGRAKAFYEPTDLCVVTVDLASHFRSAIESAGLDFKVDCSPTDEPVYVDREMWEKIVLNLLSNAFKFTFTGEITVRLQAIAGRQMELIVGDTGIGIPQNEMAHIFERFHRVQASQGRTHEGTGIGLALVQELTLLHGGAMSVESTLGKGSSFKVTLPLGKDHLPPEQVGGARELTSTAIRAEAFVEEALRWLPDESGSAQKLSSPVADFEAEEPGLREAEGRAERVLVADDNADMRDHLRRLLADRYDVSTASNGEEALQRALTENPDLILADVMMPKLDGFALLQALRSASRTRAIPVILLSARAGEEARSEGIDAGAEDYIVKPFSARELLARVGARVKQGRLRKADEELRSSLAEKEELLKEVHHRVKNNLQVISSLVNLQASRAEDRQVIAAFEETRNRVYSIGTIHEMLYRSGSFASIDLAGYARNLVPELIRFYGAQDRVRVEIAGDTLTLELERAVPFGLILNELVSNVCKHAFPDDQAGNMVVSFGHNGGSLAMSVADSGVGLPKDFEYHKASSLGLQLVRNLARQLRATVGVNSENGTRVTVTIPVQME